MVNGILGKKLGMTQIFTEGGTRIPVTVIEAGPCTVVQKKVVDTDGYDAVQLGFGEQKAHRINKPKMGHFKKAGKGVFSYLREMGGRLPNWKLVLRLPVVISLQPEILLMSWEPVKVKVFRALSNVGTLPAVARLTALNFIVLPARLAAVPGRLAYLKARRWRARWAMSA